MTTAVTSAQWAARDAGELGIAAIAADLLPDEVVQTRRARRMRRLVLVSLAGVGVLLGGWYGAAHHQTTSARIDLGTAEAATQSLEKQKADYQRVVTVQAESARIDAQLARLMALDLRWSKVVLAVQNAAPAGVTLHSLNSAVTATGAAPAASSPTGPASIGELSVTGSGTTNGAVAAYVDALGRLPGVTSPLLSSAVQQKALVEFSVKMGLTRAVLGGRFSTSSGSGN